MAVITAIETVTREQYLQRQYTGAAGPTPAIEDSALLERWRAEFPDWRGKYWAFTTDDRDVLRLRPINVVAAQAA
ncbi:hypothetical protein [Nocardia sp. NBC_01009]|uniref:hypothetical protein n=1 Tax=Nocardia sp. NBC_01009 TaxID=2975996 RepID=UPI0038688B21|nr:hypothetical protein OHA42_17575 [Nocardia sp. NBC_01009]